MVESQTIAQVCERIVDEFKPERIVLFGSYAYGVPTEDSDVDLLVIMPFDGKAAHKATEIRLKVRPGFAVDLIVRTPKVVRERLDMGDSFMRDIVEHGKVLYEASNC